MGIGFEKTLELLQEWSVGLISALSFEAYDQYTAKRTFYLISRLWHTITTLKVLMTKLRHWFLYHISCPLGHHIKAVFLVMSRLDYNSIHQFILVETDLVTHSDNKVLKCILSLK